MRDEWPKKSLGELIEIKHGFAFKGEFFQEGVCKDVLLTPGNFTVGGGFKSEKFKFYGGPVPNEYVLRQGDLIVTMTDLSKNADTLGYPAIVPLSDKEFRFLHNQRLGKVIVKNNDFLDCGYLYYLMCSRTYRHEVLASATGTTVKHTAPERIKRFRFDLPPLGEQRRIANILGSLDDKIELNRQMNETLEAMARAIFKSWFVDFDPVRAKVEGREAVGMDADTAALFPAKLFKFRRWERFRRDGRLPQLVRTSTLQWGSRRLAPLTTKMEKGCHFIKGEKISVFGILRDESTVRRQHGLLRREIRS